MTKAKFTGKISSSDKVWENYVNIEMHKPEWKIVHKEKNRWIAIWDLNAAKIFAPNKNLGHTSHDINDKQWDIFFVEELFTDDDFLHVNFEKEKIPCGTYFASQPKFFQDIQSGCYCLKCKEYFPYADYEESFKCWRCKNGF